MAWCGEVVVVLVVVVVVVVVMMVVACGGGRRFVFGRGARTRTTSPPSKPFTQTIIDHGTMLRSMMIATNAMNDDVLYILAIAVECKNDVI